MADRVAVINAGILQQVAAPQTLFDEPDNLFVAAFIGSPSMNLMEGVVTESGGAHSLQLGSQSVELPASVMTARPALRDHIGKTIVAGIRPKDFEDASIVPGHPAGQRVRAQIENVEALGYERIVYFGLDAKQVIQEDAMDLKDDAEVLQHVGARITGRFDPASTVRAGDEVEVAVAAEGTHFFDLETGLAIRD